MFGLWCGDYRLRALVEVDVSGAMACFWGGWAEVAPTPPLAVISGGPLRRRNSRVKSVCIWVDGGAIERPFASRRVEGAWS